MRRNLTVIVGLIVGLMAARWLVGQVNPTMLEADTPALSERDWLKLN